MTCVRANCFHRLDTLDDLFGFDVAGLVLRINVNLQFGQSQCRRLRAGRALEPVMNYDDCRVPGPGEEDSVAHGAGGAGPSAV